MIAKAHEMHPKYCNAAQCTCFMINESKSLGFVDAINWIAMGENSLHKIITPISAK